MREERQLRDTARRKTLTTWSLDVTLSRIFVVLFSAMFGRYKQTFARRVYSFLCKSLYDQPPMTMVSPGPNLLDLATELLLMMFELLDEDDLFRLSLSSTRLHYVALEFYLSRQPGSYSKTHVLIVGPPFTMLPALRMALFVQDLPKVSVMFMTGPVIQGMRGLERLIRRI